MQFLLTQKKFSTESLNVGFFCSVKKRIDRTQARLDKLSNQELILEAAHALRIERERQKELKSQLEHQTEDIQRASTVSNKHLMFRSLTWTCEIKKCNITEHRPSQ